MNFTEFLKKEILVEASLPPAPAAMLKLADKYGFKVSRMGLYVEQITGKPYFFMFTEKRPATGLSIFSVSEDTNGPAVKGIPYIDKATKGEHFYAMLELNNIRVFLNKVANDLDKTIKGNHDHMGIKDLGDIKLDTNQVSLEVESAKNLLAELEKAYQKYSTEDYLPKGKSVDNITMTASGNLMYIE